MSSIRSIIMYCTLQPWPFELLLKWFRSTSTYPGYAEINAQVVALLGEQAELDVDKKARLLQAAKTQDRFVTFSGFIDAFYTT